MTQEIDASHRPNLPTLVGRDRELDLLRAYLREAQAGRGGLVLISGEAGVGKTALAAALAGGAPAGVLALVGPCYDGGETPPYGPWAAIGRGLGAALPAGAAPPFPGPDAAASRAALFARARDSLAAAAAARPLLLVLEDLHWADAASLDLLRALARGLAGLPLLLLATYRASELRRGHPLQAVVPALVREAGAARLELRPLDAGAVRGLARARYGLPGADADRLAAYLLARTAGNPLFLTELLGTLEEEGVLRRGAEGWALGDLAGVPVPLLLQHVIDARLARLDEMTTALLDMAAVIGQEVPLEVWVSAAETADEAVLTAAEQAEGLGLVVATEGGAGIRFIHALIREALYVGIPTVRRHRLHRRVGEVLAASVAPDPDAVAYHLRQAGDERAAGWLVRAAERAEDAHALATAAERYAATFALLDASGGDLAERGWLRLLAAALRRYQDPDDALSWVGEASQLAVAADDASLAARAQALRGLLLSNRGRMRTAIEELADASEAIDRLPPASGVHRRRAEHIDRIANRGTLIECLAYAGRLAEAREQGERLLVAMAADTTPTSIGMLADVHNALAMCYALQGEPGPARRAYAAAIAACEAIGSPLTALFEQREELTLVLLPYHADDLAARDHAVAEVERSARRLLDAGAGGDAADPRFSVLPVLVLEGYWREARALAEMPYTTNLVNLRHVRDAALGALARAQGDPGLAWGCVRAVWPDGPATAFGDSIALFAPPLLLLGGALALDAGDLAGARGWLDAHRRWLDHLGAALGRSEGAALAAAWHRAAGDPAAAGRHAAAALRHATSPRQPLALLAAHRLGGELAAAAGDLAAAGAHLDAALALADACRAPYERALTLLARAALPTAGGGRGGGRPGRGPRAPAAAGGRPGPRPRRRPGRRGRRQRQRRRPRAARPCAAGRRADPAIAARLGISPRTVKAHTAAIYGKLGVTNRAAAIRFALDHGLA